MFKPHPSVFVLLACVACGSDFTAGSTGAAGNGGGDSRAGASAGGDTSNGASAGESSGASAGESSGGADTAGDSSSGGRAAAGSGGAAHAGASSGGTSSGGTSAGGGTASAGAAGTDCAALKTEYAALVKKARVCSEGSTDQCTTASKAPNVGGCGCPTLVNANSEYTALAAEKYKAIQKNSCEGGLTCQAVCLPPTSASCAQSSGTGTAEFVCTGTSGGIAN